MAKNPKPCYICGNRVKIRYRVQYDDSGGWRLICPDCWRSVSANNPLYRYGGTWKARKD